jgi:hypothetical protein
VLLLIPLAAACDPGGGGDGGDDDTVQLPDGGGGGIQCTDPQKVLPEGWTPVNKVSAGQVGSTGAGTITTTIDATAGGFGASAGEPFVYLSFTGGAAAKVSLADPDSFASSDWDLAFKRYVIRANGGDSGPGGVAVAKVDAASLAEVTAVPTPSNFLDDQFATDACVLVMDQLGAPITAVGEWYIANGMTLTPKPVVHVVKLRDGSHIKLRIVSYYGGQGGTQSGYFTVEWAAL